MGKLIIGFRLIELVLIENTFGKLMKMQIIFIGNIM